MIIDAHSHYIPPEIAQNTAFFKSGWSDIDQQLSLMDQHGIEQALLLYPTSDAHLKMGGWQNVCRVYNQAIAETMQRHPKRFIGAGILPADSPEVFTAELNRIRELGLRVLSLASSYEGIYLDHEMFDPVHEFAQKYQMPVHVHAQILNPIGEERIRDPLLTPVLEYVQDVSMSLGRMMMSGTFLKYPKIKYIFAHYGGVLPLVKERFDTTYLMLRRRGIVKDLEKIPSEYFKNLYFDTSGSQSPASLLCATEVAEASHILFGTDFPANQNYAPSTAVILNAPLSAEKKAGIMGGNLVHLLLQVKT